MFVVESSARHVHVSQADLEKLFGAGYQLTKKKDLSQPGQFVCNEKVEVVGEKGSTKCSIMGPVRKATQVELSLTDARGVGVTAPIKESGDLAEAGACTIKGPNGEIKCDHAVIAAKRHIHMTPADAAKEGVKNGQIVKVKVDGMRPLIFDDVVVRVSDSYALAMHIDTDEANAAFGAKNGEIVK